MSISFLGNIPEVQAEIPLVVAQPIARSSMNRWDCDSQFGTVNFAHYHQDFILKFIGRNEIAVGTRADRTIRHKHSDTSSHIYEITK